MSNAILPDIPVSAIDNIEEQYNALVDLRVKMEELLKPMLTNAAIADADSGTATTVSNADKINVILATLRNTGIIIE